MPAPELELIADLLLATSLVALALLVLFSGNLFKSVVLFIVFGLLMSVVWVRLGAPDIALAEAAIGTGLTAALLLEAVRQLERPADAVEPGQHANGTQHDTDDS